MDIKITKATELKTKPTLEEEASLGRKELMKRY